MSYRIGKYGSLRYLEAETSERGSKFKRSLISVKESMLLFPYSLILGNTVIFSIISSESVAGPGDVSPQS